MIEKLTGLISKNSLEYVQHAFRILNDKRAFVNLQNSDESNTKKGVSITEVLETSMTYGWHSGPAYTPNDSSSVAQISYTSGTEGAPKGVVISHAALANTTQRLINIMNIDSSIREYVGIPVNYSFGFGRCRAVSAVGGEFFLPQHGFNPLEISQMLEADEINAISAVPSLWRLLLETPEIFEKTAGKVRWIEIGSQYMTAAEKNQLRTLFGNAKIIQHYGLTEASRSTFLDIQNIEEKHLESVGKGYFGVETSIDPDGRIKIRGPHLASSLLIDGKSVPLVDKDGWLTTNDGGHIDSDHLYFDGRLDDVINLGGIKLSPENLEAALVKSLDAEAGELAIFKTDDVFLGNQINLAVLRESKIGEQRLRSSLKSLLAEQGLTISSNFPVHQLDEFPLTDTGKLKRSELSRSFSEAAENKPTERPVLDSTSSEKVADLVKIWEDVLKIDAISPQDNFFDIGGDSISAIRVTLRMEKSGIPKDVCRKIFEGYSIEHLVASLNPSTTDSGSTKDGYRPAEQDRTQQMISIWQDVLKIDSIGIDDSFFDLGGDSLSAIRVVTRMEKAGIPKDVCRKIFEGHSIKDILSNSFIVGSTISTGVATETQGTLAAAENGKVDELIRIWRDVLKIENVTGNDSFFDLGGDSLSAIRVVVRMESAGIPKDVCRKIFEGHSIKDIVGHSESSTTSKPPSSDRTNEGTIEGIGGETSEKLAELIEIWQDVLKIENLTENDSFFDLGGDSLSAIRVIVRMESAGIPKDTCRKIFEGHSIRNIVSDSSYVDEPYPAQETRLTNKAKETANQTNNSTLPLKRTSISSANLSLNVIRGLLVILNISAHWMPGVIARLPTFAAELNKYLAPLYSSGTPGFALIFGAGLSFFVLPRYRKNKASVNKLCKRNACILFVGISCLASVRIAVSYLNGFQVAPTDISNAFYSVLFYYFFAVISIPVWLKLLTWRSGYIASCLILACIFYSCHLYIDALNIPPSDNPIIQTGILILTPKYNYLEMSAAVMLGAAAGSWIKAVVEKGSPIGPLLLSGVLLIVLSVFISFETGEYVRWFDWPKGLYLWTWPFYLGCVLVGFYYIYGYIEKHDINTHPILGFLLRIISVIGVMAFPLFIGHELVRPLAELLSALSVPGSLGICLLLFFGSSYYLLRKLYKLYYATDVA